MMSSEYKFGPWKIDQSELFYATSLCYAFVNYKPVVDGHVLITSKRLAPRFADLSAEEAQDLWTVAHKIGPVIEKEYGAASLTFAIQDGVHAGQTVPHVHIHILPRKEKDFEKNDELYDEMDSNDHASRAVDANKDKKPRSAEEMAEEASRLAKLFSDSAPF